MTDMFFRREKPTIPSFDERVRGLSAHGFTTQPAGGKALVQRQGCAALLSSPDGKEAEIERMGLWMGDGIGILVDHGYQKFFEAGQGKRLAATAMHLRALHSFEEDLREYTGIVSLYNQSLGSENTSHMYDRVRDRDKPRAKKPWEVRL